MEYKKALTKAMHICSQKEQCIHDINEKLDKWEVTEENAAKIISSLLENGFIDEERYLTHFIADKLFINKWGKRKTFFALKMKDIPESKIQTALDNVEGSKYSEMILHEMEKKKGSLKGEQYMRQKAKLFNFGSSRGYEPDMIYEVLGKLFKS